MVKAWVSRLLSLLVVVAFVAAVTMPWAAWFSSKISLTNALAAPSLAHPLGTDNLGRDLLVRTAAALYTAVLPLWAAVLVATACGITLALVAITASIRPLLVPLVAWFDLVAAALVSIPVCLAAFAWAALRERAGLEPVLYSLMLVFALRTYLQLRDLYRHDEHLAFWTAHAALGGSLFQRLVQYGLAGAWRRPLATSLGFHLRTAVAIEASLSYLGFGIQEPSPSFGNMLAAHFDLYLKGQWYVLAVLVLALALTAATPQAVLSLWVNHAPTPRIRYN